MVLYCFIVLCPHFLVYALMDDCTSQHTRILINTKWSLTFQRTYRHVFRTHFVFYLLLFAVTFISIKIWEFSRLWVFTSTHTVLLNVIRCACYLYTMRSSHWRKINSICFRLYSFIVLVCSSKYSHTNWGKKNCDLIEYHIRVPHVESVQASVYQITCLHR